MQQALLSGENKLIRLIVEPEYRWLRHLLLCGLLFTVSYENVYYTFGGDFDVLGWTVPLLIIVQFVLYLSFYLNIYILVPRFLLRGRYAAYTVSLFTLLSLNFVCSYFLEFAVYSIYSLTPSLASYVNSGRSILIDYISLVSVTGMCCIGTTITILFRNWLVDVKRKQDMESDHRRNRILRFKDMVNPFFLSGTLTAAARQTKLEPGLSADILVRLSRFLRYRLYDSSREMVFLQSEVAYLDNYLSLVANVRQGFTYSITTLPGTGRARLPSSVLTGVIDALLNTVKEAMPLDLVIEFTPDERMGAALRLTARSPGSPSLRHLEEMLKKVLDISYPSGYELFVRGGGGKLFISVGLNQNEAL